MVSHQCISCIRSRFDELRQKTPGKSAAQQVSLEPTGVILTLTEGMFVSQDFAARSKIRPDSAALVGPMRRNF